jgi:flagellar biosynthesis/type III secretory pathway chaperone
MNTSFLLTTLQQQLEEYSNLYELSCIKTNVIKQNDIAGLNDIINKEAKYLLSINDLETKRIEAVYAVLSGHEWSGENPTLSDCLKVVSEEDSIKLTNIQTELKDKIEKLREQNYLNQELIYQSMQFVSLSLSMLKPKQTPPNYGPSAKPQMQQKDEKLFDSQV